MTVATHWSLVYTAKYFPQFGCVFVTAFVCILSQEHTSLSPCMCMYTATAFVSWIGIKSEIWEPYDTERYRVFNAH